MNRIRTLFVAAACLLCFAASAQWQWIDKDGRKVYSDRAPPPEVPLKNILRQPGNAARNTVAPTAGLAADNPARTASAPAGGASGIVSDLPAPKLSSVDKDLAEKKRLADVASAAKLKAEEERVATAKTDACERARSGKSLMDSGVRVSITNAKGEREILDDAARAAELKRIQTAIDANCR